MKDLEEGRRGGGRVVGSVEPAREGAEDSIFVRVDELRMMSV